MTEELTKGMLTQKKIVDTAYELFVEQGYHGTSMRQISEKAEITIGGIYNHFSGKDEIFEKVVLEYHPANIIFPMFEQIKDDTFEGSIREAAHLMSEEVNRQKNFFNLFYIELVEFKGKHVITVIKNLFPKGLGFIQKFGHKKGNVKPFPAHTMLVSFLGMFFSFYLFNLFFAGFKALGIANLNIDNMIDIFLYGVMQEQPNHEVTR
jgi:AcrR family transcriptional regulator